ncbi:hypothetical protein HY477_01610 [Candidatus Uhrbacteria bacterium]|nr:hypothetical protein [Candidatus Uhrbacteria bacterium]
MPKGEGRENSFDQALARLDCGYKEMRDGKLYLAQESGTLMGAVPFVVEGSVITGPDGTRFDLVNMQYKGETGLYAYLKRISGTAGIEIWNPKGNA